jgi:hypothetical protein
MAGIVADFPLCSRRPPPEWPFAWLPEAVAQDPDVRHILHDMTRLRRTLHGREVRSFEELVRALGLDAVASPRRSTVPLVDYWRAPEQRLRRFWESLGIPEPEATEMHFEYEAPVRRGRGKS